MMRLKYDMSAGALYIKLGDHAVAKTQDIDDNTSVDVDNTGGVVGIKVISMARPWAFNAVLTDFSIPPDDAAQLRAYFERAPGFPGEAHAPALTIARNAPVCVAA